MFHLMGLFMATMLLFQGCDLLDNKDEPDVVKNTVVQTGRTAVILVMGQSNIANHGAATEDFNATAGPNVYNFYNGELIPTVTPASRDAGHLATGNQGNILPMLGDGLMETGKFDKVIFVNIAVGGSSIEEWTPNYGKVFERVDGTDNLVYPTGLFERVKYAKVEMEKLGLRATHILWHQGESDNIYKTSKLDYKARFLSLKEGLRNEGITAPIYMARASYLLREGFDTLDYNITDAQTELISEEVDIFEGPNTDTMGAEYRYDFAHFNKLGLIEHAKMWVKDITK